MNILFCKSTKRLTWAPCFQKPLVVLDVDHTGDADRTVGKRPAPPHPTPPRTRPGPSSYNGQQATSDTKEISLSFPFLPRSAFPFPPPLPLPLSLGARRDRAEEPYRPPLAAGRSGGGCSAPRKVRGAGLRLAPAVGAGDPASGDAAGPAEQGVAAASSFFVLARKFRRFLANVSKTHRQTVAARC